MRGLLIYDRIDIEKNDSYAKWLIDEGKVKGLDIKLVFSDVIKSEGIDLTDIVFAINRSRSYEISLMLELNDIRVFNNSYVTLLGNNKLAAYGYAKDRNIPIPKIVSQWSEDSDIISKPIDGHGGQGIDFVNNVDLTKGSFRLQQRFVKDLVGDVRFYIIDNEIIHSVIRSSQDDIRSNYSVGGNIELFEYVDEHLELVKLVLADIKADYIGLDFLVTKDNKLLFNEIEDVVGSRMLSQLGVNNTTSLFIEHIFRSINL